MKEHIDLLDIEKRLWEKGALRIAGLDEAGRGPLAGPVVAAAVVFPPNVLLSCVNDSKKLTPKKREAAYHEIYREALAIGIGTVGHEVIDRINILQETMLAMNKALDQLRVKPDQLLVDGNFFHHESIRVENIIHGDARSHSIGAASIIAKVTRDALMREYDAVYPQYGFSRHKGYGTKAHFEAIRQHGYCSIHRRSFHISL